MLVLDIITCNEPRCEKTCLWGFPTRSDRNQAVKLQKMARFCFVLIVV